MNGCIDIENTSKLGEYNLEKERVQKLTIQVEVKVVDLHLPHSTIQPWETKQHQWTKKDVSSFKSHYKQWFRKQTKKDYPFPLQSNKRKWVQAYIC